MTSTPFTIAVDDAQVADLHDRLRRTRVPDVSPELEGQRGPTSALLRELTESWLDLDWRDVEHRLNALPQVVVDADGTPVHLVHVRSGRPDATTLVLLHGWPDGPFRYRHVAPLLADPDDDATPAFDVVIPSLPGFAFSGHAAMDADDTADLLARVLVDELGEEQVVVAGGDVGSVVALSMARRHPGLVRGVHLTNVDYPRGDETDLDDDEQAYAAYIQQWWQQHGAYAMVQSTKPGIVGPALADSPVGMAAFMLGLVDTGADDHDVDAAFGGREELLTNLSIYWFTNTAASAADTYLLQGRKAWGERPARVETPTGVAIFPREAPSPRSWCERQADVVRYTHMPRGGHFAALEVPEDYVAELRAFVADLDR